MSAENQIETNEQIIKVSPAAVKEIKRLMDLEDRANLFLRLDVASGGCSGMSYNMSLDDQPAELDREFDFDGLKVRVDLKALMYLKGTELDFGGGLMGGGFKFSNPNAKRSCGCGSSFTC